MVWINPSRGELEVIIRIKQLYEALCSIAEKQLYRGISFHAAISTVVPIYMGAKKHQSRPKDR
jgi:hypothetical protein